MTYLKILFVLLLTSVPLHCHTIDNKLYIDPSALYFEPNRILLNLGDSLIEVSSICVDEFGIHIPNYDAVRRTLCSECGRYYDADNQSSKCLNGVHPWYCQG